MKAASITERGSELVPVTVVSFGPVARFGVEGIVPSVRFGVKRNLEISELPHQAGIRPNRFRCRIQRAGDERHGGRIDGVDRVPVQGTASEDGGPDIRLGVSLQQPLLVHPDRAALPGEVGVIGTDGFHETATDGSVQVLELQVVSVSANSHGRHGDGQVGRDEESSGVHGGILAEGWGVVKRMREIIIFEIRAD